MSAHHHDHHHHHGSTSGKRLIWALGLTLGFAAVEAVAGWWSGSLALLGDAGHMVSDATALGLAAFAATLAAKPPTARLSYGLGRAEIVAALVNAALMLGIVAGIVTAALGRFSEPQSIDAPMVILVAAIGLAINITLAILLSQGEQTLNVRGALLHVMGDLLGSVAALVSGVVIYLTGWTPIDPILSVFICALILISAVRLLLEGLHVIMEGVPAHLKLREVGMAMAAAPNVRSVHDLHIWTVHSGSVALSAHVVIDEMSGWPQIMADLNRILHDRFDIEHSTLQPECHTEVLYQIRERDARQ